MICSPQLKRLTFSHPSKLGPPSKPSVIVCFRTVIKGLIEIRPKNSFEAPEQFVFDVLLKVFCVQQENAAYNLVEFFS